MCCNLPATTSACGRVGVNLPVLSEAVNLLILSIILFTIKQHCCCSYDLKLCHLKCESVFVFVETLFASSLDEVRPIQGLKSLIPNCVCLCVWWWWWGRGVFQHNHYQEVKEGTNNSWVRHDSYPLVN